MLNMSDILYTGVIFSLKLVVVIICSPLIGCIGLVTVPLRFWQALAGKLKASADNVPSPDKASVRAGRFAIFAASIGWVVSIAEIVGAVTCTSAGCALAGLGVFLILSLFGSVYGLAELLLFPATFPRHANA